MGRRVRIVLFAAAAAAAGCALYATWVEPRRPLLRRVSVPCPGLSAPVRVLLFSDVDFPRAEAGRALIRRVAAAEPVDIVAIAGDYLDRRAVIRDPRLLREAARELAALPARCGRFLAPGEAESGAVAALREAWSPDVVFVGANDRTLLDTPGGRLDLFVADVRADPAPWGVQASDGRPALVSRGRTVTSSVTYVPSDGDSWSDVELTFAFRLDERDGYLDARFGWRPGVGPDDGTGWRILRHEYHGTFRLRPRFDGEHILRGRTESGYAPIPGLWHRARITLRDDGTVTRIRARFWPEGGIEPAVWLLDATDSGPDRRHRGTIAFAGRYGARAIADLRVVDASGRTLLAESFDDEERFRSRWTQRSRLAAWLREAEAPARVVLAHNPDVVLDIADVGQGSPAVILAGHTHGGQVRVPLWGPVYTGTALPRSYASGSSTYRGIPLFVTVGVGTSVVPVRFLVRPEVVIVTLEPAGSP